MKLSVNQLLGLVHGKMMAAAPDGLKKNTVMKHLGQLSKELGAYGDYEVPIPKPTLSKSTAKTLESFSGAGFFKKDKDCGCK